MAVFYSDNGLVQAQCPERLQSSLAFLIKLFERVGLQTNTLKAKSMVCVPGRIRTRLTDDVYNNSREGLLAREDWYTHQVECVICNQDLAASLLASHLETQHDI